MLPETHCETKAFRESGTPAAHVAGFPVARGLHCSDREWGNWARPVRPDVRWVPRTQTPRGSFTSKAVRTTR